MDGFVLHVCPVTGHNVVYVFTPVQNVRMRMEHVYLSLHIAQILSSYNPTRSAQGQIWNGAPGAARVDGLG